VLPHVHVSLAFLLCVSLVPKVMRSIEQYVPWVLLVAFLNTLGKPGVKFARVEPLRTELVLTCLRTFLCEDKFGVNNTTQKASLGRIAMLTIKRDH
jgi:hypothetical protein